MGKVPCMSRPRVGVILAARLASSRFPRKVLAPLGPWTLLEEAMFHLEHVRPCAEWIIATDAASRKVIAAEIDRGGVWKLYAGDPTDVMKRLIDAARRYRVGVIVRATGDNPLVDWRLANRLLALHLGSNADATRPLGATPGTAVEIVSRAALERAWPGASATEREHVMPAVYAATWAKVNVIHVVERYPVSVTVDVPSDLDRVKEVLDGGR